MKFNENTIKGKWLEIKGEVQKSWGKLTNDEIDKTKGDMKALGGIIQQKYGEAQESYDKKLSDVVNRFETKKEKVVENMKRNLKN